MGAETPREPAIPDDEPGSPRQPDPAPRQDPSGPWGSSASSGSSEASEASERRATGRRFPRLRGLPGLRSHRLPNSPRGWAFLVGIVATAVALLGALVWSIRPEPNPGGTSGTRPESVACVTASAPQSQTSGLEDPAKLEIVRQLIASAENSTLDWQSEYGYLEYNVEGNDAENRGYTGGIVGFTSKTHDMLLLVQRYTQAEPDNPLAPFLPALEAVDGTSSADGLGRPFARAWAQAATAPGFQRAQRDLTDELYITPAVTAAHEDGLGALGQYIYVDTMVMHGSGTGPTEFTGIRDSARGSATPPSDGGDERAYLEAFLDARGSAMSQEEGHRDLSRVQAQRSFVQSGNLALIAPLQWTMYGDSFTIVAPQSQRCP